MTENQLSNYMVNNWKTIFPDLVLERVRPSIRGFYSGKLEGEPDFRFRARGKIYIAELKWSADKQAISAHKWDCLKAIGYAKMYGQSVNQTAHPCVIINKVIINQDYLCMLDALKVKLITVERRKDGWHFEKDIM